MTARPPKKHSLARRIFRWCRIGVLLLILALAVLVLWSNYVAVPEFVAAPVRAELREDNVALEFKSLRLSGFRRLIAEQLRISPVVETNLSRIEIPEGELRFRYGGSWRKPIGISGLRLAGGDVALAISEPGEPPRFLSITNLHANVEFKRDDTLRIVDLSGKILGAHANISGALHNFSQFRLASAQTGARGTEWRKQVADVLEIAQQLSFSEAPEVTLTFSTDAADLARSHASVSFRADEGTSRWGGFHRLRLNSNLHPLTNQAALRASFSFELNDLGSDSVNFANARLRAESLWSTNMQQLLTNHVTIAVANAHTRWFSAPALSADLTSSGRNEKLASEIVASVPSLKTGDTELTEASLRVELEHALPFPTPGRWLSALLSSVPESTNEAPQEVSGKWSFQSARTQLPRVEAESISASGEVATIKGEPALDPNATFWNWLRPFDIPWQVQLSNLTAGDVQIGSLATRGRWKFPELRVEEIKADLYQGKLNGHAALDVAARRVSGAVETSFDYHQAAVLLDAPVQRWLEQFGWENPPFVQSEFGFDLPPWTSTWEKADRTILPTLTMGGHFAGRGSFRGVPLGLAESHFTFTNFVWSLPDLRITRPEGSASLSYVGNVTNQEIAAKIESRIYPSILSSAFDKELQPAFEMVRFTTPPLIHAEIRGDLDDITTVTARGTISATNFFAREQAMTDIATEFFYTNQVIELRNTVAHRGKEQVVAPYSRIDIPAEVMFVTNAVSTIDPWIAMSLVDDQAYEAIDPYRFANTPNVTINGLVPLTHVDKADLYFSVSGTEFTYWRFHLPQLSGDIHWKGFDLTFSNVHAAFYNGTADWSAHFVIDEATPTAQFSFHGTATNASLRPLVKDLFEITNRLEGTFSGDLVIVSANTASIQSWNGFGRASLTNGYLWSVPIFGVFTPALDSIVPGLGAEPINSGRGNFTVTNSVIYTRDLQVRAPAFRLDYKGNVDLDGKLDARVDAELLRDTWMVGKLFSTALWPVAKVFEARVTGTLTDPKTKLRYVPKIVLAPFKVLGAISEAAKKRQKEQPLPPAAPLPAAPENAPPTQ